jgi:hypothetical protein
MTLFTTGPDGMTGNDDLGTMSAWYVFSSLGLYPTMSGANFLAVSSPQFDSAVVDVAGRPLTITAPGASDSNRYIQRARVNGAALTRNWIPWSAIGSGGTIAHTLGSSPSAWGTATADQPPSVNQAPADGRTRLDAAVRPGTAALAAGDTTTLTVDLVGQAPTSLQPRVSATAPAGWTITVQQPPAIVSGRLPVSATATLTVRAPAGAPAGAYPVEVTVTGGPTELKKSARLVVGTSLTCAATPAGQCAVNLAALRTRDGTATVAASAEGNFDGSGWSYDAALLPAAGPVTWGGVTYDAPDPAGTAKNFVGADGSPMLLPGGSFSRANLVLTSHNGPVGGGVTIGYTDGTTAQTSLTVPDWCATSTTAVLAMPHRIKAGQGVDGPPVSLFGVTVPLAAGKTIRSLTLPADTRIQLYALTLAG